MTECLTFFMNLLPRSVQFLNSCQLVSGVTLASFIVACAVIGIFIRALLLVK